ncbi:MAG: serine hydroxymethyltransferase, partial [Phycisphaerae bacterium]|nr:serine hydroxymethyltransferase [Phycisphaerae bacterium]NIX30737.1 serine hydroxymethyltransferase [Phycisphaerae bacterium]
MENSNLDHNILRRMLHDDLNFIDPFVSQLIQNETDQQMQKLILVPSVSAAPEAVLEALGSKFQNVCAEGQPASRLSRGTVADLQDVAFHLADNRRYANRRFYKGVNYVDLVESLAQRRCAALFAHGRLRPEHLFVNVQALSGGTANLAVYQGLMNPGDTLMGMSLNEGGHLSHGAAVNLSGQLYRIVSYGVDKQTELLNYEAIRQLALEERPQVIVAGYTAYPWQPDWEAFRAIADEVDAFLVADIAHTAGLVIAGEMPNPVGIADVTTLTTNKTLLGPRSAIVITTDRSMARAIDNAIFPGAQGAPHPNKFAAVSVALELAATAEFRALQSQIVTNAKALAASLERCGMRLVYGGTNTHLFVIDLKSIPSPTGEVLYGEPASRILELAGIIVNRNTIPGDKSSPLATGLRMGTPWITQRGLKEVDMERLANLIYQILSNIHPFTYNGLNGLLPRGKIDIEILEPVKQGIQDLVQQKAYQVTQNQPALKLNNKPTSGINISGQRARQ